MNIIFKTFLVMSIFIAQSYAQPQRKLSISGQVFMADMKPAEAATILLTKTADSSAVKTTFTNTKGEFLFDGINTGSYRLSASLIGYEKYFSKIIDLKDSATAVPPIVLQQNNVALNNVTVTNPKAFIEHKIDRTVVNVDALISNAGTSALDVLEKSPGILVDPSGTISLKGKQGVVVFIDDKPTYMSGTDLQNYLRSLPSSTLEQIEIMTNPPAKYDAAGGAGIINIKTKKNKVKGFNGNFSLAYNQGIYARGNSSLNLNYRKNKLNLFANLSYARLNSFNDLDIYRRYKNPDESTKSFFIQNTFIRRMGNSYNVKAGADFYLNENTTLGVVLTAQTRPTSFTKDNVSHLLNASSQPDSIIKAFNTEKAKFKNSGLNVNYRHQFDKNGRELTADLDYINYRTNADQVYNNTGYLPDGQLISADILTGKLPSEINIYSAKTDYIQPLKYGYKLSVGLKSSYTTTDNMAIYATTINNVTDPDYEKSNHFLYKENINAAYFNFNKDYKKLSIQAGFRLEQTSSNGHQLGNIMKPDSTFSRNYTSLFPTLYLSYKLDSASNNQFAINYGRRIERPYYQDLNPFIAPLDKFTYYVGNPFLNPAFTHNIELSHTYKNKITTTLSYSSTKNDMGETIEILDGTYYSRPGNIGSKIIKSIAVDATLDPAKWLNIHIYTELTDIHSKSNFYTGLLDTKGTLWLVQPNAQFKFKNDWSAELNAFYRTDIVDAQFISQGFGRITTAVQKKFASNSTIRLSINDIFYTMVNKGIINNLALTDASYHNKYDSRQFILSFSYRFGKAIANQRKHENTGAETEQNRVKN